MTNDSESWTEQWDAVCVTVTRLTGPEAAQRIALGELTEFPDVDAAEQWVAASADFDRAWFAIGTIDDWTFIWEANGWQGSLPEVALRLADSGPLASLFWNVNAVMSFLAMDGGVVLRQFDPLFHDDEHPPTEDFGAPRAIEAGLDWTNAPRLSGLQLLAATAGVRDVDPSWLEAPHVQFWGHRF
jgi:hypothetical protein